MNKLFRALLICTGAALIATGCASGPQYKDVASAIPTLAADHGRIYFFRADAFGGAAIQPDIKLNDKVVGRSVPGAASSSSTNCRVCTRYPRRQKSNAILSSRCTRAIRNTCALL